MKKIIITILLMCIILGCTYSGDTQVPQENLNTSNDVEKEVEEVQEPINQTDINVEEETDTIEKEELSFQIVYVDKYSDGFVRYKVSMYGKDGVTCNWKSGSFYYEILDSKGTILKRATVFLNKDSQDCINSNFNSEVFISSNVAKAEKMYYKYHVSQYEPSTGTVDIISK